MIERQNDRNMVKDYDVPILMKRNFCIFFEIDRNHHECIDCPQIKPCELMETTVRDILAKKEKHDQEFVEKFKGGKNAGSI